MPSRKVFLSVLLICLCVSGAYCDVTSKIVSGNCSAKYNSLKKSLSPKARLLCPGSTEYEQAIQIWAQNVQQRPEAVVKVANNHDISSTIRFSKSNNVDFAVKCGGHNTNGFASSKSLILDLSLMNSVTVERNSMLITIEGGALWRDVDSVTAPLGIAPVGGRVSDVGVGGFTTGGGFSWFTAMYGLAVDNLVEMEVVMANGEIVVASPRSSRKRNRDLFWALTGGSGQFGVVSKFVMQGVPAPALVYAGFLAYAPNQLPALWTAVEKFFRDNTDPGANVLVNIAVNPLISPMPSALLFIWYPGTETAARTAFADFFEVGPVVNQATTLPYIAGNRLLDTVSQGPGRRLFFGYPTANVTFTLLENSYQKFAQFIQQTNTQGTSTSLVFEYIYPKSFRNVRSDASTAWPHKTASHVTLLQPGWSDPRLDNLIIQHSSTVTDLLENYMTKGAFVYPNYGSPHQSLKSMYGPNLDRLIELKARFDPDCVFQHGYVFPTKVCKRKLGL